MPRYIDSMFRDSWSTFCTRGMEYGGDEEQDGPPLEIGQRGLSQYREDGRPDTKLTRHNDDLDGDDGQYEDGHHGGDHGDDYPAADCQRHACSQTLGQTQTRLGMARMLMVLLTIMVIMI